LDGIASVDLVCIYIHVVWCGVVAMQLYPVAALIDGLMKSNQSKPNNTEETIMGVE
jgi:hypothetical protein